MYVRNLWIYFYDPFKLGPSYGRQLSISVIYHNGYILRLLYSRYGGAFCWCMYGFRSLRFLAVFLRFVYKFSYASVVEIIAVFRSRYDVL